MTELFRRDTDFHRITVDEVDGTVCLRFNGRLQSSLRTDGSLDTLQPYISRLHLAVAACPHARRALILGLGGGALARQMHRDYDWMRIDVVELDPVVVDVAQSYFGLVPDERLKVIVEDGRRFLERVGTLYDVIIVDAYFETNIPFALATEEFFGVVSERLADGGAVAYNAVGKLEGAGSEALRRFLAGIRMHLPEMVLSPVGVDCGGGRQNIVVIASRAPLSVEKLGSPVRASGDRHVRLPAWESVAAQLRPAPVLEGCRGYRDSEAPLDGLLHL